jgi:hypothetical protein
MESETCAWPFLLRIVAFRAAEKEVDFKNLVFSL